MTRDEVLERLDAARSDRGPLVYELVHVELLRAAAELIRQGEWRPIAEGTNDSFALVGRWRRGEWTWKVTPYVKQAAEDGYTHYLPEPDPPAREVENG